MAYSKETRLAIRSNYINKGYSLKAACASEDVPYETGRSWKRSAKASGDDWDQARAAGKISQGGIASLTAAVIEEFVTLFQSTLDELKSAENIQPMQKAEAISRLSDAYTKTVKAAGSSSPSLSRLAVAMDLIKRQADFIKEHFPQHFDTFVEILEPFGEVVSREFS